MRFLAVDFFRGATIALMIIVNTPGNWEHVYAPLKHAEWHGCTPTDLVFPSFMFIIGVSMWFAFEKYSRRLTPELRTKILKRSAILFLIGLILNHFPFLWKNWDTWRIMGVPQRLALGYCLGSFLCLSLSRKWLIWVSAGILLTYWALMYVFALPGPDPYGLDNNAVLRLDRWVLGETHLYHGERIYFDPEGILSTLPAVVTVVLGWLSGHLLSWRGEAKDRAVRDLIFFGVMCGFMGLAWDLFFPINKKLWTSSYVLYVGGLGMIFLAASVWLIDIKNWRNGAAFFFAFGSNALFAYILSEIIVIGLSAIKWGSGDDVLNPISWFYQNTFARIDGGEFSSFLFALFYMLLCWLACRWLYVRKIFIKI